MMDVESRLVHCMMTCRVSRRKGDKAVVLEAGQGVRHRGAGHLHRRQVERHEDQRAGNPPRKRPKMAKMGEYIFTAAPAAGFLLLDLPRPGRQAHPPAGSGQPDDPGRRRHGDEDLAVLSRLARCGMDHAAPPDRLHAPGALARAELSGRLDHRAGNLSAKPRPAP